MKTNMFLGGMAKLLCLGLICGGSLSLASCGDDDGPEKDLKLKSGIKKEQKLYADDTSKPAAIAFTAAEPWSASVREVTVSQKDPEYNTGRVDWIELSQYGGEAGEVSLSFTLEENTTGADRKAEITITCGNTTLKFIITQKGQTKDEAGDKDEDEEDVPAVTTPFGKLESITGNFYLNIRYDAKGRVIYSDFGASGGDVLTMDYEGKTFRIRERGIDDVTKGTFKVNKDGFITYMKSTRSFDDGYDKGTETTEATFTYSGKHLVSISAKNTAKGYDTEEGNYTDKEEEHYTCTWKDGNLTKIKVIEKEDGEQDVETKTLVYGRKKPVLQWTMTESDVFFEDLMALVMNGQFGEPSLCLPTTYSDIDFEEDGDNYTENGTITFSHYENGLIERERNEISDDNYGDHISSYDYYYADESNAAMMEKTLRPYAGQKTKKRTLFGRRHK